MTAHQFHPAAEIRLIAEFIDTEYSTANAPDHPSATLRRYAERLRGMADAWPTLSGDRPRQADVAWVADDILDRYHCLPSEAREFLAAIEDDLQLAMIEAGWQVIRGCCEFEPRSP